MVPGLGFTNPAAILQAAQQVSQQRRPTGLRGFLQAPGTQELLLGLGSRLLAQSDQPGTIGGALGRSIPGAMQDRQGAVDQHEADQALGGLSIAQNRLLKLLPQAKRAEAAFAMQTAPKPEGPEDFTLNAGARRFAADGTQIADNPSAESSRTDLREHDGSLYDLSDPENPRMVLEGTPETTMRQLGDGRWGVFDQAGNLVNTAGPAKAVGDGRDQRVTGAISEYYGTIGKSLGDDTSTLTQEESDGLADYLRDRRKEGNPGLDGSQQVLFNMVERDNEAAMTSVDDIVLIDRALSLLSETGNLAGFAGTGKQVFQKVLKELGLGKAEAAQAAEEMLATINRLAASDLQKYGSGTGLSDTDLREVKTNIGANLNLEGNTILNLLRAARDSRTISISRYNTKVDALIRDGMESASIFRVEGFDDIWSDYGLEPRGGR